MIEELVLKDLVDFKSVRLEFSDGLVVFSGASGAGKSVLMGAILGSFGYQMTSVPALCELSINTPSTLKSELYDIDETTIIKSIKKDKTRYYLNDQNISRKALDEMFNPFVKYLSVRDKSGIDSSSLVEIIDRYTATCDASFVKLLHEMHSGFDAYRAAKEKLEQIKSDELKIVDLVEFAKFEIDKISSINPRIGEDAHLLEVKQKLSKLDKIKASVQNCEGLFDYEAKISEFYRLTNKSNSIFEEAMNQLRVDIDETNALASELEELDIESILGRLEDISSLQNKYGSLEESLAYLEQKKAQLASFEFIEEDKSQLELFLKSQKINLDSLSSQISDTRKINAVKLEDTINSYLVELRLPGAKFIFESKELDKSGTDTVDVVIGSSKAQTLSGGEFNRLRLAVLVATAKSSKTKQGVMILDEIDANVSGDESIAIANMLYELSNSYQIFAISHQPHLSAKANQHILISKDKEDSIATVLDMQGRINEIARIVSGENPTQEAVDFAKTLMR